MARATARAALGELPRHAFDLSPGDPALATEVLISDSPPIVADDEVRP
jgi:hypothetical protein